MKLSSLFPAIFAAALLGACGAEKETDSAPAEPAPRNTESDDQVQATNETPPDSTGAAAPTPEPEEAEISPAQTAGERPAAFAQCAVCHGVTPDARPMIGPTLAGIYGAAAGARSDFAYSKAMSESGLTWDDETLDAFLTNPQQVVRGNRMAYAGERNAERRAAIIDYLKTLPGE